MSARVRRGLAAATVALALLSACGGDKPPAPGSRSAPPPSVLVESGATTRERLFAGRVEGIEQTTVRAQTAGRVAAVLRDVNTTVAAGAVVLRLRGVEQRAALAQAESALTEALAREAEVQSRYRRIAALHERKVAARAALDEVTAARDAAVARVTAARAAREAARENVAYAEVAAPFSGAVAARHVQPGDVIVPGQPLFDVVSPGHLRVVIDVPQSLAGLLRDQARASVLLGSGRIESDAVKVFGAADPAAGTVRVWVDLPADVAGVFAGQFVRVAIPDGGAADLSIPAGTLVERSEVTAVYVVEKDGTVRLRQIRVGERGGERVQVLAGLSAGERIVTDPLAFMRQRGQAAGP